MDSWWTDPRVQRDYEAFRAAVAAQQPRWLESEKAIGRLMAGVATADWMTGGGKRRNTGYSLVVP